jgi:hypothetical protein
MAAGGPATFGEPRFIAHRRQCPSINLGSNPCWGPRYIKDPATPTVVAATIFVVEADHAVAIDDDRLISCLSDQASPGGAKSEEDRVALENVAKMGSTTQFPRVSNDPLLPSSGEVLEGELGEAAIIKKTLHKTTKKETQIKEARPESKTD